MLIGTISSHFWSLEWTISAPGQPANHPKTTVKFSMIFQAYNDAQQRRGGKGNTGAAGAQQAGVQVDPPWELRWEHVSNEKRAPGCLGYIRDYTTQFCRDYFISQLCGDRY